MHFCTSQVECKAQSEGEIVIRLVYALALNADDKIKNEKEQSHGEISPG